MTPPPEGIAGMQRERIDSQEVSQPQPTNGRLNWTVALSTIAALAALTGTLGFGPWQKLDSVVFEKAEIRIVATNDKQDERIRILERSTAITEEHLKQIDDTLKSVEYKLDRALRTRGRDGQ